VLVDQFGKHIGKSSLNHSPREFEACAVESEPDPAICHETVLPVTLRLKGIAASDNAGD